MTYRRNKTVSRATRRKPATRAAARKPAKRATARKVAYGSPSHPHFDDYLKGYEAAKDAAQDGARSDAVAKRLAKVPSTPRTERARAYVAGFKDAWAVLSRGMYQQARGEGYSVRLNRGKKKKAPVRRNKGSSRATRAHVVTYGRSATAARLRKKAWAWIVPGGGAASWHTSEAAAKAAAKRYVGGAVRFRRVDNIQAHVKRNPRKRKAATATRARRGTTRRR
ncbi:MAG: hypothetical protein Q8Q85_00080 [Gemmatimonadales bacterium]|nr:hypothetical protein [Gemmatimonadales bacterium]